MSIASNITTMLSVGEWFTELIMVVTVGAHSVVRYHFNRRDNFVVGNKMFIVDGSGDRGSGSDYESKHLLLICLNGIFDFH